jgi:hypothetical protein
MLMGQKEAKMDIISLGSTPPVFNFIRAIEQPPEGDHVVSLYCNGLDHVSDGLRMVNGEYTYTHIYTRTYTYIFSV